LSQTVSIEVIKELRARTSAGINDCKIALDKTQGNIEEAIEVLRQRGRLIAEKKAGRVANQGLVESYIHHSAHVGVLLELNCETDFVAKTDEFKQMAHDLAMQVAAMSPQYVSVDELNAEDELDPKKVCLLEQPFIKEPSKTVSNIISEAVAKVGENIKIRRFNRYEIGN